MLGEHSVAAVVVAAGGSSRMGFDKLLYPIGGQAVVLRAVKSFDAHPAVDAIVVAAGSNIGEIRRLLGGCGLKKPLTVIQGGAVRAASSRAGVLACGADIVAVHDGARPFVSRELITRVLNAAAEHGAAVPGVPVSDTLKRVEDGEVRGTVPRGGLWAVQTPQAFARGALLAAFDAVPEGEWGGITDDSALMERAGRSVVMVQGEAGNIKITTPQDLPREPVMPRVGHGYDVHRLVEGRPLVLGGVNIPYAKGLLGHSDADVLLHAAADALLGAAALGDIGRHFPDSDPAYAGANSMELLRRAADMVRGAGFAVGGVDATVLCEAPKLAPHIPAMREGIANALGVSRDAVSVKATTEEGLGFTGLGQGIAAHCIIVVSR